MEITTHTKTIPHKKAFDSSHMIIELPIIEEAMTEEMLNEYHSEVDGFINNQTFVGAEAMLKIDIYDGTILFEFGIERFYTDTPPDYIGTYLELSPEVATYYYKMAIKQFTDNLKNYKNI